jgi:hypothetical protein
MVLSHHGAEGTVYSVQPGRSRPPADAMIKPTPVASACRRPHRVPVNFWQNGEFRDQIEP